MLGDVRSQRASLMKRLYLEMDNVPVSFPSAIKQLNSAILQDYEERLDEVPGIFALMEPMPGAVDAFHALAGVSIPTFCRPHLGSTHQRGLTNIHRSTSISV